MMIIITIVVIMFVVVLSNTCDDVAVTVLQMSLLRSAA